MTTYAPKSISPLRPTPRDRTFRRLLGASSVSLLGSHITTIAYPLLVLKLTGSPLMAGCAVFAATVPSILAYMPAGALVDRWRPRRVMLVSEFGRGLAIGIVILTMALGNSSVVPLMVVAVVEGVLEVFSELAERLYVRSIVDLDRIPSTLVKTEARTHVALVAGRPLGGLLFGLSSALPFLADFFSFVYSVSVIARLKDGGTRRPQPALLPREVNQEKNLINEIGQGLRWISGDKIARTAIILFAVGTLIFQALIIIFLGDAHSRQLPTIDIGLVLAASGIGGALGSLIASRRVPNIRYWMPVQAVVWVIGFSLFWFPFGRGFLSTAAIMAVLGLTGALGNIALDTHVMQNADQEVLTRVTSVIRFALFTACSIGPVIGGILARRFGTQLAMSDLIFFFALIPLLFLTLTVIHAKSSGSRKLIHGQVEARVPVRDHAAG